MNEQMLTHLLRAATGTHRTPKAALVLGLLNVSLLPWFAAAVWFAPDTGFWLRLSLAYSAVTLGVLGGVRMGLAFAEKERLATVQDYATAILWPFVGWLALVPVPLAGCAIVAAGFLASTLLDIVATEAGRLPYWYGRIRLQFLPVLIGFLMLLMAKIMLDEGWFAGL